MSIITDLFSRQGKRPPEAFVYGSIPPILRVQVAHIWRDALGEPGTKESELLFRAVHDALCREYGLFKLHEGQMYQEIVGNFLLREPRVERVLDVIQLSFRAIEKYGSDGYVLDGMLTERPTMRSDQAIEELNARFLENGVGYQYRAGKMIRMDSEFLHKQLTEPVLLLLQDKAYAGAQEEFLKAHDHYRHGRTKDCLDWCLKAFETALKTICTKRKWAYKSGDTPKPLLDICYDKGLIPDAIQSHISSVRASLESGVPTVRNKFSGHGQGPQVVQLPPFYASYMLHLTGTTIHFLVEEEKVLK